MLNSFVLHHNSNDFRYAVLSSSLQYDIMPSMIEKDYWVTWCLHYLFQESPWKNSLGFKGGTCMSKAYNAISRFSEDCDVLLDWRLLGYTKNEPLEPKSKNKQDKLKHEMNKKTIAYLSDTMLPTIQKDVREKLGSEFSAYMKKDDDPFSIYFHFPKEFSSNNYLLDDVKLEIGPMSQWSQLNPKPITSMIDQAFPEFQICPSFPVLSVSPERTFWDKICILQNISHLHDKDKTRMIKPRQSRHYYDVYCLLHSDHKSSCFEQSQLFYDAINFSSKFYPVTTFKIQDVTLSNVQLSIPDGIMYDMNEDYLNMSGMLYGKKPSFEEIYNTIIQFEKEIHEYGKTMEKTRNVPLNKMMADAQEKKIEQMNLMKTSKNLPKQHQTGHEK